MSINTDHAVVTALLSRYHFTGLSALQQASLELTAQLRVSMEHTAAYGIPLEQQLPDDIPVDSAAPYLHPLNIAAALLSVHAAAGQPVDASLQLYTGGWVSLASIADQFTLAPVTIVQPAPVVPPPAPVPPAPAIIPAPAIPPAVTPAPAAPMPDLVSLVDAAMNTTPGAPVEHAAITDLSALTAPTTVAAHPVTPTVAEPVAAAPAPAPAPPAVIDHATQQVAQTFSAPPGAVGAPTTAQGVPGPAVVTHQQAQAEARTSTVTSLALPDPSVLAERTSASGRPQASPFSRKVEKRNKIANNPWWWSFMLHSAPKLLTDSPAQALDTSSTGAGPVQAYAALVGLAQELLRDAAGDLTVAELRTFLREVETGIEALDTSEAINQLRDHLWRPEPKGDGEKE
jgi:hypothetical protein